MDKLIFKYATMNSGKTLDLIKCAYNYDETNQKILIMKPMIDTKGDNKIVSRTGLERNVDYLIKKDDSIIQLLKDDLKDLKALLIDESQFLTRSQIDELQIIAHALKIDVICYGLRVDFLNKLFPGSDALFALSDQLQELTLKCKCLNKATANVRFVNGKPCFKGKQVAIDGEDKVTYVSMCNKCRRDLLRK